MKLNYKEGTVFLVPLRDTGFARGVIARASPKGKIVFGYFFGPRITRKKATFDDLDPARSILKIRFGDLGLIKGFWPIVGEIPTWRREEWRMPSVIRRDPLGYREPRLVVYSDFDPAKRQLKTICSDDGSVQSDSLAGYGAVEIKLTRLLGESAAK